MTMQRIFILLIAAALPFFASAQNADSIWVAQNIEKQEMMIPMRDGIKLYTSAYIPKNSREKMPVLMRRTPYSSAPYGKDIMPFHRSAYYLAYLKAGYILVFQDVRGKFMSEGDFVDVRPFNKNKKGREIDEASDTYDAIDYLVKKLPNNNGKVGVWGISYPGFYAGMAALSGHPSLAAVSPQAPVTDWFMGDDFHHNGVFFAMDGFAFYSSFGKPRPKPTTAWTSGYVFPIKDKYNFFLENGNPKKLSELIGDSIQFWHELVSHPNYDDFWKARDLRRGLYNVKPAMLWVGGLFDAEDLFGAWNSYKALEKQSPKTDNKIVMGPWSHGQWARSGSEFLGNVWFGGDHTSWYLHNIEKPFFDHHLKGVAAYPNAEATVFFTGENKWQTFNEWPPKPINERSWYLSADGKLTGSADSAGFKEYLSDPEKPVPYIEGVSANRTREYMTDDQRFAAQRPDVMVYTSAPLTEDLTLAGPVNADLLISTTGTDADFVVKLIDVFPEEFKYPDSIAKGNNNYMMEGYQMLVRGEIMRAKYRNSFEKPEALVPGQATKVAFSLPDVAHTFRKGHRMMVQVQSSWFPLADRNPQQFMNIYTADKSDYKKATIRIYGTSKITAGTMNN